MNIKYLEAAQQRVPSAEVLINVVSRRVRQLIQGHRPLVLADSKMDFLDIALKEIAEGKLSYEVFAADTGEASAEDKS
jgi:DNA-directed RNA polymerase subunit omega